MKRRICCYCLVAIIPFSGLLVALSLRPAPKGSMITKANFYKIVEGMTQEDVEEIFGCPPGDYTNGQAINVRCGIGCRGIRERAWIGYEGDIDIRFSTKDGRVVGKSFMETFLIEKPTLLERIKSFLRRAGRGQ